MAILFNRTPAHAQVAALLKPMFPPETYELTVADIDAEDTPRIVSGLSRKSDLFAVAVGLPAARFARDRLTGPVVFAQVFNYQELLARGRTIRGVSSIPRLDVQVQDWKKLDPRLERVGLIVSERRSDLIREAEQAGRSASVTVRYEISNSDRETLYLFKRLAPQIDGLWLAPDDRILSPTVLRELFSYAASHGVGVCVFNDALLESGALLSATPAPGDVARTARRVLEDIMAGDIRALPPLTPLSEVVIHINQQVASRLGIAPLRESWVVHGGR